MCGFTGFWATKAPGYELYPIATKMITNIHSRGPDAQEVWLDKDAGITLAHARLSVVDLSPTGAQPMHSHCGRYVIVYNGEIYNAEELREELATAGITCQGTSDTQVIVNAIAAWGFQRTLERLIGMFAMAVWDRQDRKLLLARDRIGIKPLYWGKCNGTIFFGSQLKSFRPHPDFQPQLNRQALQEFMQFTYVPAPMSIYQDFYKLLPGHYAIVTEDGRVEANCYWDVASIAVEGINNNYRRPSEIDYLNRTEELIVDAVKRRMVADVPLGAFLSGGIDSSLVVAVMQSLSSNPVKTFSIGFTESSYNEAEHAKAVARHLGTDHHELYLTPQQAQEIIPSLPEWYDEPFADSSQIPTYLVSKMAREHVTVSLSGDGGDELFAGYTRYVVGKRIWDKVQHLPYVIRQALANGIESLTPDTWRAIGKLLPANLRPSHVGDKAYKFANILRRRSAAEYYETLVSAWQQSPVMLKDSNGQHKKYSDFSTTNQLDPRDNFLAWMQLQDMLTYLPDDILAKVDRASMAVSLEARVPLLDHRLIEHSWQLPETMKMSGGQGKLALRHILYKYVPRKLIERPKMGFGVPVGDWIKDDAALRPWAEELLSEHSLSQHGLFDVMTIRDTWHKHLSGKAQATPQLWAALMFQAWAREYGYSS